MREMKFKYIYQHEETGRILIKTYTLDQLTLGLYEKQLRYIPIARVQYTGHKDRNEQEIFEDDILKVTWRNKKGYDIVPVKWENNYSGFEIFYNEFIWGLLKKEIIGNVYENPELLK